MPGHQQLGGIVSIHFLDRLSEHWHMIAFKRATIELNRRVFTCHSDSNSDAMISRLYSLVEEAGVTDGGSTQVVLCVSQVRTQRRADCSIARRGGCLLRRKESRKSVRLGERP